MFSCRMPIPCFDAFPWLNAAVVALFLFGTVVYGEAVQIDFFTEPGCYNCEQIEIEVLPKVKERFGDTCVVQKYDIGIETNFLYLLQLEDALNYQGSKRGYLVVGKQHIFGPSPDLEKLCSVISTLLADAPNVGQASSLSSEARFTDDKQAGSPSYVGEKDADPIRSRFSGFTLSAVLIAGLLDGINPCAISTLVFFMSLLAVSKVQSRQLLLLGVFFCLASFLTYLALGFGLFRVLHLFSGFTKLRSAVEWGTVAVLLVLAVFSFRDAFRFRKSHDGHDVTLQLSLGMKKRIHNVMRRGLKSGHLIFGGLFIGMTVTALESVCTGQVYVPTLVMILKNNELAESRAWLYLIAYNLLFILPLVLTFIAVYFGLRTETLLRWSSKNVVITKTLLGLFFALMGICILFMR